MKKSSRWIALCLSVVMAGSILLSGCDDFGESTEATGKVSVKQDAGEAYIDLDGVQKWRFEKDGNVWKFDGVYADRGGREEKVFCGTGGKLDEEDRLIMSGEYFNVQNSFDETGAGHYLDGMVTQIRTEESEGHAALLLEGEGFTSKLSASDGDTYIARTITLKVPRDVTIYESEISFALRSGQDAFFEYGYILTHANDEPQTPVPYAFPAITSKLTAQSDASKQFTYTEVMDYYETSPCFKTARRREHLNGYMELGVLSSEAVLEANTPYTISERISVKDGSDVSYYDMIADARAEYAKVYDIPADKIVASNGNMGVSEWQDAAYGAIRDIIDPRGRPAGDDQIWGPYGYQNGGPEAFGATDLLKGMLRYALATGDTEAYEFGLEYLRKMVLPDEQGNGYIMPLNKYYPDETYASDLYFYRAYSGNGKYSPEDSWDSAQPRIGSFKYYSRVLNIGELGLVTGDKDVQSAFMSLMPLIKKLRGEDFEQAVEWNFDCTPAIDAENGGSGGAAAMWAQIMLTAAEIEQDSAKKAEYIELAKGSIRRSNEQGFTRSSSLREYPKPESIGYAIRANLELYEMTNEQYYLNNALEIYNGIYYYYFVNSHPYTYYQTFGYGYACARERWEAFMEMVESIVLVAPILQYTDDPMLLELLYTTQYSALWTLPINGYPDGYLGGHSDWLDALYVPYEQPTGAMGDNPGWDGGGMSYLRHSKELYGIGEVFTGAMLFETFAKSNNSYVSLFAYTAATERGVNRKEQNFKMYNVSDASVSAVLSFTNFESGNYLVTIGGKTVGTYSDTALANGIPYTVAGGAVQSVNVKRVGDASAAAVWDKAACAEIAEGGSASTTIVLDTAGASHHIVEVSLNKAFPAGSTTRFVTQESQVSVSHAANSRMFVRVTAVRQDGAASRSAVLALESLNEEIGVIEDFGYTNPEDGSSVGGWTARAKNYTGKIALLSDCNGFKDYPSNVKQPQGYMAVYKPQYAGEDVDTFSKTFEVDLDKYPIFDFYPYTKNVSSLFSLKVKIGDTEYTLIDKAEGFNRYCYRFDLSQYAEGRQSVCVTMVSEGYNRGFAISRMAFLRETAYDGKSELTNLNFTSQAAVQTDAQTGAGLKITNPADMSELKTPEYSLGTFDPNDYKEIEIVSDVAMEESGRYAAQAVVYEAGTDTPVYTSEKTLVYADTPIKIPLDTFPAGEASYSIRVTYYNRAGSEINTVSVTKLRLNGDTVAKSIGVIKQEGQSGYVLDGWKSNWAFANAEGYIVNRNPSQPYGSIYYQDLEVDLDKTPILRFTVSDVVNKTNYTLKINDGTFADDIALIPQRDSAGTFTVNLRDKLNRGGVIKLRMDFYVLHEADAEGGVRLESVELLTGKTAYESLSDRPFSTTESETFTVDLEQTPYINVNIEGLTYGSAWIIYVKEGDTLYELKTVYESVYGKMYSRKKVGSFKYDLRDILPDGASVRELQLVIKLDGENSELNFRSVRLSSFNDLEVQNICGVVRNA